MLWKASSPHKLLFFHGLLRSLYTFLYFLVLWTTVFITFIFIFYVTAMTYFLCVLKVKRLLGNEIDCSLVSEHRSGWVVQTSPVSKAKWTSRWWPENPGSQPGQPLCTKLWDCLFTLFCPKLQTTEHIHFHSNIWVKWLQMQRQSNSVTVFTYHFGPVCVEFPSVLCLHEFPPAVQKTGSSVNLDGTK